MLQCVQYVVCSEHQRAVSSVRCAVWAHWTSVSLEQAVCNWPD